MLEETHLERIYKEQRSKLPLIEKHICAHFRRHRILAGFPAKRRLCSKKEYSKYKPFEDINAHMKHVEKRMRKYIALLTKETSTENTKSKWKTTRQ
jgi:hypothetical protein